MLFGAQKREKKDYQHQHQQQQQLASQEKLSKRKQQQ
jgi:hypothetical protein